MSVSLDLQHLTRGDRAVEDAVDVRAKLGGGDWHAFRLPHAHVRVNDSYVRLRWEAPELGFPAAAADEEALGGGGAVGAGEAFVVTLFLGLLFAVALQFDSPSRDHG